APSIVTPFVPLSQDRRFLYPLLPTIALDAKTLALTEFRATGRTLSEDPIERDPVSTDVKADLALAVELETPPLKQFAITISGIPQQLLESIDAFSAFLGNEASFQLDTTLDAHVLAQVAAGTPAHGKTGSGLIERVRNAVSSMRGEGANPTILALS